jgi:hypothetical protein
MTFSPDVIFSRLPEDMTESEWSDIKALLQNRMAELSPSDRAELIAMQLDSAREKVREVQRETRGGAIIGTDKAEELNFIRQCDSVYKNMRQVAERTSNTALLRDLERYRNLPSIAVLRHMDMKSMLQLYHRRLAEKEEER